MKFKLNLIAIMDKFIGLCGFCRRPCFFTMEQFDKIDRADIYFTCPHCEAELEFNVH